MDAIIGGQPLFAVDHDVIALVQRARHQLFEEMVADHAVTDHG